jgi:hypothetical protein
LLPASTAEKLSVAIFYSLIIFPLAYTAFAYPLIMLGHYIDVEIMGKINTLFTFEAAARYTDGPGTYGFSSIENREKALSNFFVALPVFFIVQTLFLLFSVVFKRYAFLKTVILVTLLFLCGFYFNVYTAMLMVQNSQPAVFPYEKGIELMHLDGQENVGHFKMYEAVPYSSITVTNGSTNFRSYANKWKAILPPQTAWIAKLCYTFLIIFIWAITFFRLRENQV